MSNTIFKVTVLCAILLLSATMLMADCKLMALMGLNKKALTSQVPASSWDDFTEPCLLKLKSLGANSSSYPNNNPDGWGIVSYNDDSITVDGDWRNSAPAYNDTQFDNAMNDLHATSPRIVLGHVRNSTNITGIDDPHPFRMMYGGREYSFIHNGNVDSTYVKNLINNADPNWFVLYPPTHYPGHGMAVVDSEYYFKWIMLNIHQSNGNVVQGLKTALKPIYTYAQSHQSYADINFILTDGLDIYAYRQCDDIYHPLAYFYDMNNVNRNYYYTGVMTIFPTEMSSTTITHEIGNNELVFLSSTGNVVRLPVFIKTTNNNIYTQKIGFHSGVNWTGFPIMRNNGTATIGYSGLNYFTNPNYGGLTTVVTKDNATVWIDDPGCWSDPAFMVDQYKLYKLTLTSNSPSIHTWNSDNSPLTGAVLIDPSAQILGNIDADQEYWISYTLLPSQNIKDAFGSSWENVASVRAENWFYSIPPVDPKDGTGEEVPIYSWTTEGKNMDFGKGYIVTFKNDQSSFTWNRSYAPSLPSPGKEKSVCFTWEDKEDYVVVDIVEIDDQESLKEIGVFQGDKCIGAVKTDIVPCQILIYPDYEDPTPLTFQIVYDSKSQPLNYFTYQVYDQIKLAYCDGIVVPEKDGWYLVKLSRNNTNAFAGVGNLVKYVINYPNPFNPDTNIKFALHDNADVKIAIYNTKGQVVRDFGNNHYNSGIHSVRWDGKDNNNKGVSSGIYFIRININTGQESHTHKILMLK